MIFEFFILFIIFETKHLLADYFLQFEYMYMNKGKEKGWLEPLLDHAGIHAIMTFIIIAIYLMYKGIPDIIGHEFAMILTMGFVSFDFITHAIIDRWKATRKTDPSKTWFWLSLGIDQYLHHIVHIFILYGLAIISY